MANEILIAIGLVAGLVVALEGGFQLGRKASKKHEGASSGQIGAIQAAVLGLLGLLLGFSFAGAASRFLERQDLIVQEANAIGTAFLRADLLDEPYAANLRKTLAEYVQHRLEVSKTLGSGFQSQTAVEVAAFHMRLWAAARDGVKARPSLALAIVNPVNEVIDLHSSRYFSGLRHLPPMVVGLLIACSLLAMTVMGYGGGLTSRRCLVMNLSLALLIAAALWITIDFDHPRAGLIRLSDAPLQQLNLSP